MTVVNMTDYREEQNNEIEALESIYPSEFEILETEPYHKFKIDVKSDDFDEEEDAGAGFSLVITYTSQYPDEPPIIEILPLLNLDEESFLILRPLLEEQCSENLGMVMVFTLVSFSLEWLNNKLLEDNRREEEEKERLKKEEEERERKKFEGTRVTVESFLAWKAQFDAERLSTKSKDKNLEKNNKLTGRELFMTDKTLEQSDLSFIGAEDEVAVDESLFQDLDDLDLDEEELDEISD